MGFYWGKQRTSVWPKRGERSHPGATLPSSEAFLTLSTSHGFVMPGAERAVASAVTGSKENITVLLAPTAALVSRGEGRVKVEVGEQLLAG